MSKSSRLTPNQFGPGLTLDSTRLEQDLVALANRYNAPLPSDIARRWTESHIVAGFLPNNFTAGSMIYTGAELPQAIPYLSAYNGNEYGTALAGTASALIAPTFANPVNLFRAKANRVAGIDPSAPSAYTNGIMLQWEASWTQSAPCLLDSLRIVMATDSNFNTIPEDALTIEVLVDSALASERREASLMPLVLRDFAGATRNMTQSWYASTLDLMEPAPSAKGSPATVPTGLCIDLFPRQPLPEDARVRVILTLPVYDDLSPSEDWPWQRFVLTAHATVLQPLENA
jgi:hypothetical protein